MMVEKIITGLRDITLDTVVVDGLQEFVQNQGWENVLGLSNINKTLKENWTNASMPSARFRFEGIPASEVLLFRDGSNCGLSKTQAGIITEDEQAVLHAYREDRDSGCTRFEWDMSCGKEGE